MVVYAIEIDGKYFKDYVYAKDLKTKGRWTGHTQLGSRMDPDDIVDIITTDKPERQDVKYSIGEVVKTLCSIEKVRRKKMTIVPIEV